MRGPIANRIQWQNGTVRGCEVETRDFQRHAAYHEAGHVVANLVSGYRFFVVTIRPDESGEYEGSLYRSARGRARDLAVVHLAGIVASAKMTGCDPWENPGPFDDDKADIAAAGDFIDNWVAFLARTYGESSLKNQIREEIRNSTRVLVDENWNAIEVIAGALLEKETLSYDDVIRILMDVCPDFRIAEKP